MPPKPPRKTVFEDLASLEDSTILADSTDLLIYGDPVAEKVMARTAKSLRGKMTEILRIYPNTLQPRRAVPSELRAYWRGDPKRTEMLFERWLEAIAIERGGREFIYKDILEGKDTTRGKQAEADTDSPAEENGPLAAAFLKLVELAASIKRDGLTNPITIAEDGDHFIIETGERRWLAFHLLKMLYGEEDWGDIPARQVQEVSVWRQASENNARNDLNAISRARQLSLLLMAIHGWDKFQPMESFQHEREFYAQVADGNLWRIPKGYGEQLLNAMDLTSSSHLRRYRAILRVDNELWDAADDNDWTERFIRDKESDAREAAMQRDLGHSISDNNSPLPHDDLLAARKHYAEMTYNIAKVAQRALIGEISTKQRLKAIEEIKYLREWLAEQEKLIKSK